MSQNYLLSTAALRAESTLHENAVSAHDIQIRMEDSQCALPVLILDCCREWIFQPRKPAELMRGFGNDADATVRTGSYGSYGSYVALACAPSQRAEDGRGSNGMFTEALLNHIGERGLRIDDMFSRVRNEVEKNTNTRQVPWSNHNLRNPNVSLC